MVVYSCHCLNVRIFAEKRDVKPQTATCPLGSSCESVELIDQGFQFSHKCLVHRVRDKDWTVYMCVPCCMRTHAVKLDARMVVVNSEMKKGDDAIQLIKNSPDFSPVFNMLLCTNDGKQRDDGIQPQSYETLQKQLGDLQDVLSHYLKQEEDAMEKRIRDFEESERVKFVKLKEKAQNEKAKLISVLFHNSEGNHSMSASNTSSVQGHALLSHSKSANEYSKDTTSHIGKDKHARRLRDSSPDVFAMDELDISEAVEDYEIRAPTNKSEKRIKPDKTTGSHVQQFGRVRPTSLESTEEARGGHDEASLMSTSMPISMPAHARNLRNTSYLDEEFEESAEFDDIPRNMQALSESIQERDRYIFGDRPRQRVHTGDFTQVNWH